MSRFKLKSILTLAYSAFISVLFCLAGYLISLRISYNYKETFFLIGLVLVLIGIVVVISKNQNRVAAVDIAEPKQEEDEITDKETGLILLGLNGFTSVFTGVFLLVIDVVLR